jgi:hypothetical protein
VNGTAELHGGDYATDFLTDLLANRSIDFMTASVQGRAFVHERPCVRRP